MKILVAGSGGWGTALALSLLHNGHDVTLWSYCEDESRALAEKRENPFLPGVKLPQELRLTACVADAEQAGLVVFATPSFAVDATAAAFAPHLNPNTLLVSVTKGIVAGTGRPMTEIITARTGMPVAALSGPSHAEEVSRGIPTGVVVASPDQTLAETVQTVFMSQNLRVSPCPDIIGIAMGAKRETFAGLAGVGDLIVTCTSMHSRNRRAGILIGQGVPPQEAMKQVGAVVEGYYAAKSAWELAQKHDVVMPITQAAYRLLYEGENAVDTLHALMSRQKTCEVEGAAWAR